MKMSSTFYSIRCWRSCISTHCFSGIINFPFKYVQTSIGVNFFKLKKEKLSSSSKQVDFNQFPIHDLLTTIASQPIMCFLLHLSTHASSGTRQVTKALNGSNYGKKAWKWCDMYRTWSIKSICIMIHHRDRRFADGFGNHEIGQYHLFSPFFACHTSLHFIIGWKKEYSKNKGFITKSSTAIKVCLCKHHNYTSVEALSWESCFTVNIL